MCAQVLRGSRHTHVCFCLLQGRLQFMTYLGINVRVQRLLKILSDWLSAIYFYFFAKWSSSVKRNSTVEMINCRSDRLLMDNMHLIDILYFAIYKILCHSCILYIIPLYWYYISNLFYTHLLFYFHKYLCISYVLLLLLLLLLSLF